MNILIPTPITDSMIAAGTSIAEPAAGETAWVSAGTYALGDLRIRTTTHRVYEALQAHSGRTALPENDSAYWLDLKPTSRWAPFDQYTSTAATATTSLTFVLQPGYFNAMALYGINGANIAVTLKDAPAGTTIYSYTGSLTEAPAGWYEYLFVSPKKITKLILSDLPIRPNAELTVTVSAASGVAVGVGLIVVGDYRPLIGDPAEFGGTVYGASAEPVTYSYIKTDAFGNTSIVRRHAATSMRATVILPSSAADGAIALVQEVLDVPVSWVAAESSERQSLNVFGLGSARLVFDNSVTSTIEINVKGMI